MTCLAQELADEFDVSIECAKAIVKEAYVTHSASFPVAPSADEIDRIQTLDRVGYDLGVSRERVRQIEFKALRKLKRSRKAQQLFRELEQ